MPRAYYNEHDPFAAAWLRKLIDVGVLAPGDVDERDIRDVKPSDLDGYTQCHFFAGIGVWSYALRRAGWPDDRPVWTGSCPCQPFSAAGRGTGFADERHLWPHWHHLIRVRRPRIVFGEQVSNKDGLAWLDLVQSDLEGTDYASGALDTCTAGVGGPHIRQRQYFAAVAFEDMADAYGLVSAQGRQRPRGDQGRGDRRGSGGDRDTRELADAEARRFSDGRAGVSSRGTSLEPDRLREAVELADDDGRRLEGSRLSAQQEDRRDQSRTSRRGETRGVADADGRHSGAERQQRSRQQRLVEEDRGTRGVADADDAERRPERSRGNERDGTPTGRQQGDRDPRQRSVASLLGDSDCARESPIRGISSGPRTERIGDFEAEFNAAVASILGDTGSEGSQVGPLADERRGTVRVEGEAIGAAGALRGFWGDAQWILCSDERWRAVEPWTFPLAHGAPARLGRLRGYGNALNAEQAAQFVATFLDCEATRFAPSNRTGRIEDLIG